MVRLKVIFNHSFFEQQKNIYSLLKLSLLFFGVFSLSGPLSGQDTLQPFSYNTVKHMFFCLEYSEKHEQAKWVYYYIDRERLTGGAERSNVFIADPLIKTESAAPSDYRGSGYDRGHLCPAAAVKSDQKGNDETFYMSNISPQHPDLNRNKWKELEIWVRGQAYAEGGAHIVCGPVLDTFLLGWLPSGVAVPGYFYMCGYFPATQQAAAFIVPNKKINNIFDYAFCVDSAEGLTGIDFFPALADSIENKAESAEPFFNAEEGQAAQCRGTAKSTGQRCKIKTSHVSGYCKWHR